MIRGLVRLMLVALVIVGAAFFLFGYWSSGRFDSATTAPPTGSAPADQRRGSDIQIDKPRIDTAAAREAGAQIGEKAAVAAARVSESLGEGSLTAKIKAKMVLDDVVKARAINVTTDGTSVTLSGTVLSRQERDRALALARETEGVTTVVDQLVIR